MARGVEFHPNFADGLEVQRVLDATVGEDAGMVCGVICCHAPTAALRVARSLEASKDTDVFFKTQGRGFVSLVSSRLREARSLSLGTFIVSVK